MISVNNEKYLVERSVNLQSLDRLVDSGETTEDSRSKIQYPIHSSSVVTLSGSLDELKKATASKATQSSGGGVDG